MSHSPQDLPIAPADGGPPPASLLPAGAPRAAKPRRSRLVIALAAIAMLLATAVGALTVELINAHRTADEVAAAERAEDQVAADERRSAELAMANSEKEATAAEAAAAESEAQAAAAEAAQEEAQAAAAPTADDTDEYLRLLRDQDPAFGTVPDTSLITLATNTCAYFDTFGSSDASAAHVVDVGVAAGMTSRQAIEVMGAALVVLCPEHQLT